MFSHISQFDEIVGVEQKIYMEGQKMIEQGRGIPVFLGHLLPYYIGNVDKVQKVKLRYGEGMVGDRKAMKIRFGELNEAEK